MTTHNPWQAFRRTISVCPKTQLLTQFKIQVSVRFQILVLPPRSSFSLAFSHLKVVFLPKEWMSHMAMQNMGPKVKRNQKK